MSLVSVVIPTYKRNDFLIKAIDSVLSQTYKEIEIVIVDDNGDNNSFREKNLSLSEKYKKYGNMRFIFPKSNNGGAEARNIGIREATGEYIAFLDDDDLFLPTKIEDMMQYVKNNDDKMTTMYYSWVKSTRGIEYKNDYNGMALFELFRDDCLAATTQWLISREALMSVDGFDNTPSKQDSILTCKLLEKGYKVKCVPKILSIYNEHDEGRISNRGKTIEGERILFEQYLNVKENFTKKQQKILTFNFQLRFFKYNIRRKRIDLALGNFKNMILCNFI